MMRIQAWRPMVGVIAVVVWAPANVSAAGETTAANQPVDLTRFPVSVPTTNSSGAQAAVNGDPASAVPSRESLPLRGTELSRPLKSKGGATPYSWGKGTYWQGLLSLGVVLALIGLCAYAARRWLPGIRPLKGAALEILGRTHLSPKQSVALVRLGRQLVLVGITPDRISQLAVVDEPAEVAEILGSLKSGKALVGPEERFGPAFREAGTAYEEDESAGNRDANNGAGSEAYQATRGQIRSLLGKVRMLTAGSRAG